MYDVLFSFEIRFSSIYWPEFGMQFASTRSIVYNYKLQKRIIAKLY